MCSVKPENVQQINPRQFLEFDVPSDIALLQQADPTLKPWLDKVSEVKGKKQSRVDVLADATHVIRDDIFYQCKGNTEAIALPQALMQKVMELGHSVPRQTTWRFRSLSIGFCVARHVHTSTAVL